MTKDPEVQRLLTELNSRMPEFLAMKNVKNINKNFRCIWHSPDKHPSMHYSRKSNTIICYACHPQSCDLFEVMRMELDIDKKGENFFKILKYGCEKMGIEYTLDKMYEKEQADRDLVSREIKEAHARVGQTEYFHKRGLTDMTIERFKLGYNPEFKTKNNRKLSLAIIPTSDHTFNGRNTEPDSDFRYYKTTKASVFNLDTIDAINKEPVFIVEGEIDAMSIEQSGFKAIGLGGIGKINDIIKQVTKTKSTAPLIVALDNDPAGQDAAKRIYDILQKADSDVYLINIFADMYVKDANELLTKDPAKLRQILQKASDSVKLSQKERMLDEEYIRKFTKLDYKKKLRIMHLLDNVKESA